MWSSSRFSPASIPRATWRGHSSARVTARRVNGRSGLELVLDTLLSGTAGELRRDDVMPAANCTPFSRESTRSRRDRVRDVYLTIDADLQAIAEAALEAALEQTGSSGGDVLMADPRTGELLAVASRREGSVRDGPGLHVSPYEPGSTVKPFLLATLLEEGPRARLDDPRLRRERVNIRTAHRVITDVHTARHDLGS